MKRALTFLIFLTYTQLSAQTPNLHWTYQDDGKSYDEDRGICTRFDNAGNIIVAGYVGSGCTDIDIQVIKYSVTGDTLWESRYDGSGDNQEDYPTSLFIDDNDNIYITGKTEENSFFHALTLKYDASGNLLWDQRYLAAESEGNDISVDDIGNVFICGYRSLSNNKDFLLIKYNSSGAQQWMQNYTNGNHDEALSIETDAAGAVYVTGRQSGVNFIFDWATLKYNSAGGQVWLDVYSNPNASYTEEPVVMEKDLAGNLYVAGFSLSSPSNYDYYVIKYDSAGTRLWESVFDDPAAQNYDVPVSMKIDNTGNVFVLGNSIGQGTGQDICTVKFNSSGDFVWQARIDSIQQTDYARSLELDHTGNYLYVTGDITVPGTNTLMRDIVVARYDTSGMGINRYVQNGPGNNFDLPFQMDVNTTGNVVVTGMQSMNTAANGNGDIATQLFNAQLTPSWTRYKNGDGFTNDQGIDMVVDETGNSYVCGFTRSGDIMFEDLVVFKVNKSGERVWKFIYQGSQETSSEMAVAIAIDAQKNVYVTGTTDTSTGTNYRDIYTVKLNPAGQVIWEQIFAGNGNGADVPVAISADTSGNVYVAANTINTGTGLDATLICYSPTGILNWVTPVDKGGIAERFNAMVLDNQQNIVAAGAMVPASGALSDGLVVKFDPAGTILWDTVYDFNPPVSIRDDFNSIATDASGNVFVCGQSNFNFVTAKYSPAGIPEWIENYSYSNFIDSAATIAIDINNDVLVAGTFGQTVNADYGIVKYHNDGSTIWARKYNNTAGSDDILKDMALDDDGNIFVTGWETSNFTTNYNFMTLKYDSTGTFQYELIYEDSLGVGPDFGKCIGLDSTGNIYMMGDANENCWGNAFINGFRWNTQVVRFGQGVFSGINDNMHTGGISLYPNPAGNQFTLMIPSEIFGNELVDVSFYDLRGSLVFRSNFESGRSYDIATEDWPSGMFFFIARNANGVKSGKLVIQKN